MPAAKRAGVGHNSNLTDLERQSLFLNHVRLIQGQHARVEVEKKAEKVLRKDARNDGISMADIDFALLCRSTEDEKLIPAQQIRRNEIMRWLGLPVGTQAEFNFRKDTAKERARREGAASGWAAFERKSPYTAGTPEDQEWLTAYDEAQAQAREHLQSAMQKKSQERMAAARRTKKAESPDEGEPGKDKGKGEDKDRPEAAE